MACGLIDFSLDNVLTSFTDAIVLNFDFSFKEQSGGTSAYPVLLFF